jgi:hypothetical protein
MSYKDNQRSKSMRKNQKAEIRKPEILENYYQVPIWESD